ncbi:MAG: alpha/beta hydrolase [Dongiaceae bacterium]
MTASFRIRLCAPAVICLLALGGCVTAVAPAPVTEAQTRLVFYGTNRIDTGKDDPAERYGSKDGDVSFGVAQVSIPEGHEIGSLEEPGLLGGDADPDAHVVVLSLEGMDANGFLAAVAAELQASSRREALIFVHGFNTSFAEAVQRTAQLSADLDWNGAIVAFSWPAGSSLIDFSDDREAAEEAAPALAELLELLDRTSVADREHLIAHSMGNRVTVLALSRIAAQRSGDRGPIIDELILAAPEMDKDMLEKRAPALVDNAGRITLYVSRADRALMLAGSFTGDDVAGGAGEEPFVYPGIETIDASAISADSIGHSYYGTNRLLLGDIHQVLNTAIGPDRRFGLGRVETDAGPYWAFRP